jgi:hypothetical protein
MITIDMDVTADEVRVSSPLRARHHIPGITPNQPVWVDLDLPKGSALVGIEIRPLP